MPNLRHRRSSLAGGLVAALALCLAACGGSTASSTSSASSNGGTAAGTGAATAGAATTTPPPKATCDQITTTEVEAIVGGSVTMVPVKAVGPSDSPGQECGFEDSGQSTVLDMNVYRGSFGLQAYQSDMKDATDGVVTISGVGDKAFHNKLNTDVTALHGDLYCNARFEASSLPGVGDWESNHGGTSTVTPAIADAGANLAGTICNRIFASGNTTPDLAALKAAVAAP